MTILMKMSTNNNKLKDALTVKKSSACKSNTSKMSKENS